MSKPVYSLRILIDTREQAPYSFDGYEVAIERGGLMVGDYSVPGLTDRVALERKSLDDLVGCLTRERDRFERELFRARGLDSFAVIVEASWEDLARGRFRSRMSSKAACQSVLAMQARGTAFLFAGSRKAGEYAAYHHLRHYLRGEMERLKEIEGAHKTEASQ